MRELTETLGYHMHYYLAAETEVICSYKQVEKLTANISIPKYSIIESVSKIPYVTLADGNQSMKIVIQVSRSK